MLGKDFFSTDSKTFFTPANNLLTHSKRNVNTCCITTPSKSFTSPFDQIYSNKLNILNYDAYDEKTLERTPDKRSVYFSDHLPVYAEIQLPEPAPSAPSAPSSGGSKRFTLRNNNNNSNNNNNNSKSTSRKIKKHASMPTTRFSKKKHHSMHKHKTRRHKH